MIPRAIQVIRGEAQGRDICCWCTVSLPSTDDGLPMSVFVTITCGISWLMSLVVRFSPVPHDGGHFRIPTHSTKVISISFQNRPQKHNQCLLPSCISAQYAPYWTQLSSFFLLDTPLITGNHPIQVSPFVNQAKHGKYVIEPIVKPQSKQRQFTWQLELTTRHPCKVQQQRQRTQHQDC